MRKKFLSLGIFHVIHYSRVNLVVGCPSIFEIHIGNKYEAAGNQSRGPFLYYPRHRNETDIGGEAGPKDLGQCLHPGKRGA